MASRNICLVLFVTFALFSVVVSATHISAAKVGVTVDDASDHHNFTIVCDFDRLVDLGLDPKTLAYCDKSLRYNVRAKDLIDRMTLAEKVKQLSHPATGVPRLGLPPYNWWSEALHGISNTGPGTFFDKVVPGATSFPTVILTTASFNKTLWKKIGQAISTEGRAMYNLGRAGLTFWSPNINVVRDPRWGRILETPGEDPLVVGLYATNFVRGLQDIEGTGIPVDLDSRPLKVSACCKHYTAYDVDNWQGFKRESFNAKVTEQDMLETFNKPFEMCVKEGDVSSVMCSYNSVDGIPTCADSHLLRDVIRGQWGLHGYIVADCSSVEELYTDHRFLNSTQEEAVALTLKAGLNLECAESWLGHEGYLTQYGEGAVKKGIVSETDMDTSLNYLYVLLMRVGFFDGLPELDYLGKKDVCSAENIELATEAAREGIVLLENYHATLPLDPTKFKKLAVVGPLANATLVMLGNYAGIPCNYTSPIAGFSAWAEVDYKIGCAEILCKNDSYIMAAVESAKEADATIIVVGLDQSVEAEGLDRNHLLLPGYQTRLVIKAAAAAKGPVILVIMSAGGIDVTFAKKIKKIKAILWVGYPGEQGGRAIADVVFGKYNPGGRLPITWYPANYVDQIPMTTMQLRPLEGYPGRTYKFYTGPTVYPFGYGLSYTQFNYKAVSPNLTIPGYSSRLISINLDNFQHCRDLRYDNGTHKPKCPAVLIGDMKCDNFNFEFEVHVTNVGTVDGSDVVIVYSHPPSEIVETYKKQVIGFEKVLVKAGKTEVVKFLFNACKSLGIVDYNAYHLLPSGIHTISLGDTSVSFPIRIRYEQNGVVLDDFTQN